MLEKLFPKPNQDSNAIEDKSFSWNASKFFSDLTARNKFAREKKFTFCRVSGLDGFEEALQKSLTHTAFVCVSDISQGYTQLNNTPQSRRVKTVFLAMRHVVNDRSARERFMDIMRELFRQFMSVLIMEQTRLQQNNIYLDPRISFQEIDKYFFTGCACAWFQIAVDTYTDLQFNKDEWI
jgi:hypothetical protein